MPRPAPNSRAFARAAKDAETIQGKRAKCLEDFNAFVDHILCDKRGKPLPPCPYSTLLGDALVYSRAAGKHLGIIGPPGLGKSTIIRLFFIWSLGKDPTISTVVISADKSTASKHVAACRSMFLHSRVRHVFPDLEPDRHVGEFKNDGKGLDAKGWTGDRFHFRTTNNSSPHPAMEASAATPKTEDRRVDMLDGDDLMSLAVNNSPAMRKQIIESVEKTWLYGRLSNLGWAVLSHNCWSRLDLLHTMHNDTRMIHLWSGVDPSGDCEKMFVWLKGAPPDFPLIAGPDRYGAEPIAPPPTDGWERAYSIPLPQGRAEWTPAYLRGVRDNPKTEADFGQFHGLRAQTPEDLVFPGWEGRIVIPGTAREAARLQDAGQGFPGADALDRAQRFTFAGGLDIAGDTRDGTVLTILARARDRRIFPLLHRRYRDFMEVAPDLQRLWDAGVHFTRLAVENNAVQSQLLGVIKADAAAKNAPWRHRIVGFKTGAAKMSPEHGLPRMDALIRSGEVVWPAGEANNPGNPKAEHWRRWEREMGTVTRAEVMARGKTPDSIMSFWFALSALDDIGWSPGAAPRSVGVAANKELSGIRF